MPGAVNIRMMPIIILLVLYLRRSSCFVSQRIDLDQIFPQQHKRSGPPFTQFEVVTNNNSAIVGQLVGDGIIITGLSSTIELCLDVDIANDNDTYTTPDFALFNKTGEDLYVPIGVNNASLISDKICANINSSGTYFPIFRLFNWTDITCVNDSCDVCGGDNSTCLGCDGIPNSNVTYDACGVCNGTASNQTQCINIEEDDVQSTSNELNKIGIIIIIVVIATAFIILAVIVGLIFTGNFTNKKASSDYKIEIMENTDSDMAFGTSIVNIDNADSDNDNDDNGGGDNNNNKRVEYLTGSKKRGNQKKRKKKNKK